ncbi:heavy metal translocating P-type ATPase [Pinibacter aurantiacus]|uniref:Cadmium-translocating P-type ATPase n=1 Tax=Pinibacter aurantiacus TaxID=2851599 RepID=A0A9E2W389_9BACT|nr:cation-translocating P-type ATPase [Pinibacter aurantiacus]MBV4356554.1 cadmium-translocating P-type ATPase [Pinibacter aurantiacus]
MEAKNWKVEGMDCANCALTISKYLEKQGAKNVKVSPIDGDVAFEIVEGTDASHLQNGIEDLGYKVVHHHDGHAHDHDHSGEGMNKQLRYVLICLPFTLVLMLHMLDKWVHIHWLMNGWVQLALCLPVYITGMSFFGKSAFKSLRSGYPNMNVLVALGSTAAFVYSLIGVLAGWGHEYLFFETTATIITLVFFGNYLEDASVQTTQRSLNKLAKSQKVMANMIAFDGDHKEVILPIENTQLKNGDLVLIKSGEQVPADCKILWGDASVNEAIITGESLPLEKHAKDKLVGGSIIADGTVKAIVTAEAKDSVLSNIIDLVKKAQGDKPPAQLLADKISAIFVPLVLGIAALTFILNYIFLKDFTPALMRSIAVLVIACPCAMGLATPAAIAVGLGRAAKNGVLFRNAKSLEAFKNITQVVFDKTGTLTTGKFIINSWHIEEASMNDDEFKRLVYSLEKFSNHPIADSITTSWKRNDIMRWKKVEEIKGKGMHAFDNEGNEYWAGSYKVAETLTKDGDHNVYIVKNDSLVGWLDVQDELRPEATKVIDYLHSKKIKTVLLSGDRRYKCEQIAAQLHIDIVIAEQTPEQKLKKIEELSSQTPTAMVGDGINDAPALAKATVGISLSEASQVAVQTADVVLMDYGLKNLPLALGLGKHTFLTIKQNLFWAFIYNIVAIPVAAFGLLTPTFGALVMGLSDVVLAVNSVRLFVKRVV